MTFHHILNVAQWIDVKASVKETSSGFAGKSRHVVDTRCRNDSLCLMKAATELSELYPRFTTSAPIEEWKVLVTVKDLVFISGPAASNLEKQVRLLLFQMFARITLLSS